MTEIKRLSDDDVALLKGITDRCSCCCLDISNNKSGKSCFNYVGIAGDCSCRSIKDKAILLEREARERDKMEKKQLPTESELRAELEAACTVINNHAEYGKLSVVKEYPKNEITVNHDMGGADSFVISRAKFRSDIEPPAKYRAVFVRGKRRNPNLLYMVSSGKFDIDGRLAPLDKEVFKTDEWCDCLDRSHHSAGWDMAWIEGVV